MKPVWYSRAAPTAPALLAFYVFKIFCMQKACKRQPKPFRQPIRLFSVLFLCSVSLCDCGRAWCVLSPFFVFRLWKLSVTFVNLMDFKQWNNSFGCDFENWPDIAGFQTLTKKKRKNKVLFEAQCLFVNSSWIIDMFLTHNLNLFCLRKSFIFYQQIIYSKVIFRLNNDDAMMLFAMHQHYRMNVNMAIWHFS